MAHSGKWEDRSRMAWQTWWLGAAMIAAGAVGLFIGAETITLIAAGATMVTGVVAIMVGGKVLHDKGRPE